MKKHFSIFWILISPIICYSQSNTSENSTEKKVFFLGSSLCAGVQDNGLTKESQKQSYSSMIANQMGINLNKADLQENEKFGLGTQSIFIEKGRIAYNYTNSKGEKSIETEKLENLSQELSKVDKSLDDYSLPFLKIMDLHFIEKDGGNPVCERKFLPYYKRFLTSEKYEEKDIPLNYLLNKIEENKYDFFVVDLGFQDVLSYIQAGGYRRDISYITGAEYYPQEELIKKLARNTKKGFITTIPNILQFPIFSFYSLEKIKKKNNVDNIYIVVRGNYIRPATDKDIFLPNKTMASLMDDSIKNENKLGLDPSKPIENESVFSEEEQKILNNSSVDKYNNLLVQAWSKQYNIEVFDLNNLFIRIINGNFITDDGVLVNPNLVNGNFFSGDGIHPSSFGQSVIANELIKQLNSAYLTNIPLLKTTNFLKK